MGLVQIWHSLQESRGCFGGRAPETSPVLTLSPVLRLPTPRFLLLLLLLQPLSPWILQDAYSEIAYLFAEFFRDLDIVPSDIIAGLVLLRQRQRAKRSAVLDEVGKTGNLGFPAAPGFPGSSAWLCPTSFLGCSRSLSWGRTIMATSGAFPEFFPVVFPSQRAQLVLSQVWNLE